MFESYKYFPGKINSLKNTDNLEKKNKISKRIKEIFLLEYINHEYYDFIFIAPLTTDSCTVDTRCCQKYNDIMHMYVSFHLQQK